MNRKWLAFPVSAGILIVVGIAAGPGFLSAQEHESPLEKLMEKVNKHNSTITKAVRNKVNFTKSRKDVVKSAKDLAKLGKEAKPMKEAIKKAKSLAEPQKKWDEYMDEFVKASEHLVEVADKPGAEHAATKDAFKAVSSSCASCHKDFRTEEGGF
jgi:cytochrome c556